MYRLFVSSIITSLLTAAAVRAAPVDSSSTSSSDSNAYPRIALNSEQDFCLFLPPQPGLVVAINEDNGIPFCTKPDTVYNSTVFPEGIFITTHFEPLAALIGYIYRFHYNSSLFKKHQLRPSHWFL